MYSPWWSATARPIQKEPYSRWSPCSPRPRCSSSSQPRCSPRYRCSSSSQPRCYRRCRYRCCIYPRRLHLRCSYPQPYRPQPYCLQPYLLHLQRTQRTIGLRKHVFYQSNSNTTLIRTISARPLIWQLIPHAPFVLKPHPTHFRQRRPTPIQCRRRSHTPECRTRRKCSYHSWCRRGRVYHPRAHPSRHSLRHGGTQESQGAVGRVPDSYAW